MRQRGVIVEKRGQTVWVKVQNPAAVCGSCKGCVRLAPERTEEDYVVRVDNASTEYAVGDEVILEGQMGDAVKALALLYGVPFITLFVGYGLTRFIAGSDPLAGIGAVIGLLTGALGARLLVRRQYKGELEFKIVARACS